MDVLSIYQYTSWIQSAWDSACLMIQDFQQLTIAAVCHWEDHCTCSNTKNTARRRSQCNSLLSRLPMSTIQPLQHVMNAVARVIMNLSLRDHVKPALMQLHWLPVEQRISVELAVRQPPVDRPLCHHDYRMRIPQPADFCLVVWGTTAVIAAMPARTPIHSSVWPHVGLGW